MGHDVQDEIGLRLARLVAAELIARPELVDFARSNLRRWRVINAQSPGLVACYDEWLRLLDRPIVEIVSALTAPTEEGQRLRQNSPFAGVLLPARVWEEKRRVRDEARSA